MQGMHQSVVGEFTGTATGLTGTEGDTVAHAETVNAVPQPAHKLSLSSGIELEEGSAVAQRMSGVTHRAFEVVVEAHLQGREIQLITQFRRERHHGTIVTGM